MPSLTRSYRLALCGVVAVLVYLVGLGGPALWEPDEGRYAEIARAMVVSGDYVTPRNDGVRYFEKPPLVYWTSALAIKVCGRNEFAVRFPAALASAGSVVVTAAAGELMYGPAAGIVAALALGLSPLFFIFAQVATPDPLLAFFFTAALLAFHQAASRDFGRGAGRCWMLAAAALLALATLAKGPVALALGGGIGLGWLVSEGRRTDAWRIRWPECAVAYLAIVAPWFVLVARRNPGFLTFFFLHEHLQRFTSSTEHGWGPWFFAAVTLAGAWPFVYFVPAGLITSPASADEAGAAGRERSARRFLTIWFVIVIVFFSIPRSKLAEYLLPGLPPLALLAGAGLARIATMEPGRARRLLRRFALINVGLFLAGALGIPLLGYFGVLPMHASLPVFGARSSLDAVIGDACLLILASGVMGAVVLWLTRQLGRMPVAVAPHWAPGVVGLLAVLIAATLAKARIDATPLSSYRELAYQITPQLERGCVLASYHHFVQGLPFYTGRQEKLVGYRGELAPFSFWPDATGAFITDDVHLREAWSSSCVILVINHLDWSKLAPTLTPPAIIIGSEGKKLAVTNRAAVAQVAPMSPGRQPSLSRKDNSSPD